MTYKVGKPLKGPRGGAPVVSVRRTPIKIAEIHFATTRHGSTAVRYIYYNSNSHPDAPGDLQFWARGSKITTPEWVDGRKHNLRACFTRKEPVAMAVKLVAKTKKAVKGTLRVTPKLEGSTRHLKPGRASFTYPANAAELWVSIHTTGAMPDEVGRYALVLNWKMTGAAVRFKGPKRTRHRIYAVYGPPLDPEYDSAVVGAPGRALPWDDGTLTGTQKRFDHLMTLVGGKDLRHKVTSTGNLVDLYWNLHKGLNDTPGAPPYFDAGHDEHMTTDGTSTGTKLPVTDQWLALVKNSATWNDCSCIGHVQIAKTMLAAIGLFARRTWVFPHTKRLPDGSTATFVDTDYYCLGNFDPTKMQRFSLKDGAHTYVATLKLMEPGIAWENFEACMLTPTGKFLTGGYNTSSNPASFRANKGFNSAAELLRWWSGTSRAHFGKRFQAWIYSNSGTGEYHAWDVDGNHYDIHDYVKIRDNGKQVPTV
jgi:hypothetical protein